jgi:hypothetical protein
MSVLTIALILEAELIFVRFTHALQIQTGGAHLSASAVAKTAAANHEYLAIMMLIGAIIGMIGSFGVIDTTAKGQLVTMLFLPLPMIPALALGIALGGDRVLSLTLLAVVLAVGTYLRRFGPRGMVAGMLMFMGFFLGFFLASAVTIGDLGWLSAAIGVGVVVAIAIRFAFFYPRQAKALERTQRSYSARARKVAALALELFDDTGQDTHETKGARRLHRHLVRLNEAALMIDAQLGDPGAVADGSSGQLLHQRLFDVELALTNIARFAEAMSRLGLPANQRSEVRLALLDIVRQDLQGAKSHATKLIELLPKDAARPIEQDEAVVVVPHRFAGSVINLTDAATAWMALGATDGGKRGHAGPAAADKTGTAGGLPRARAGGRDPRRSRQRSAAGRGRHGEHAPSRRPGGRRLLPSPAGHGPAVATQPVRKRGRADRSGDAHGLGLAQLQPQLGR